MIVYKITNLINNRIYIGKTIKKDKSYYGSGKLIILAIKKYGKDNFKKEIIEYCNSIEEMNEREKYWIKKLNSFYPIGYNIGTGGEGQDNFTYHPEKERLKKILIKAQNKARLANKGNKNMLGKKHTEETKRKISIFFKGKNLGNKNVSKRPEVREKMRLAKLGKNNFNYGKPRSEETKRKIGKAHKGKIITEEQKIKSLKTKIERNNIYKGKDHPMAKKYIFYSPCGIKHVVVGEFKKFCKEQGLRNNTVYNNLKKGINNYKGWSIYREVA